VDLQHEMRLASVLVAASRAGLLSSAHDLADGGLAQALVESALRRGFGVSVELPADADPFVQLFSESPGRVLVSATPDRLDDLAALCAEHDVPLHRLGRVTPQADATVEVQGQFTLPLAQIRERWSATLPAVLAADPVATVAASAS
jgi:phosphoribosylformylglycinamidine synthase